MSVAGEAGKVRMEGLTEAEAAAVTGRREPTQHRPATRLPRASREGDKAGHRLDTFKHRPDTARTGGDHFNLRLPVDADKTTHQIKIKLS